MYRFVHFQMTTLIKCVVLFAFSTLALAQQAPPKAPVREVTDDYFGTQVVDPYRWMEDAKNPEMIAWMKGQSDYSRAYLDRLPMRNELLKRLTELSDAGVNVSGVRRVANMYFYYRLAPGENDRRLYVREGLSGMERLLVDPERVSADHKRYSINDFNPSFDGKLVAYRISAGGQEIGEIRVLETASGRDLGERIDRARFGAANWLPDGKSFLFNRLQELPEGAPTTELYKKSRVYLHTLGTSADKDKPVFGYQVNPAITLAPEPLPFAYVPRGSNYVIAEVNSGVSPNSEYYFAPLNAIDQTSIPWRRIASLDDDVSDVTLHGEDLYLLTYKNAARFKVTHTSLRNPDLARATTIFPTGEAVVTSVDGAKDALYVQTLDGGISRLWRVDYQRGVPQRLKLPYEGSAYISWTDQLSDGALFSLHSWTRSPVTFAYDPKTGNSTDTKLVPPIPIDMSSIEIVTVKVKSFDGTMIPLVILHKKGLKRDGANPTWLYGYGAYGSTSTEPGFSPYTLAWLERGGVLAYAGVRGGGEYGEEWHLAGKGKTKSNTWKDFIECAEYLIHEKYTSPQHLAGIGASAGGILIGNAIAERPDLFGAAIIGVGVNNALRMETTSNGVTNTPEFGSVKTEEGFKALLAMDAYTKVTNGEKYPAVLLQTGINDPRVEPWMSGKMTARLQAATTSGKPVLLRVDYDAGHGNTGTTKMQFNEKFADFYAFLLEQVGTRDAKSTTAKK